jgi:hypothetical protein
MFFLETLIIHFYFNFNFTKTILFFVIIIENYIFIIFIIIKRKPITYQATLFQFKD